MSDFPRFALFRSRRVRILYYLGDGRFRILQPDDSQRSVSKADLTFL